MHEQRFEDAAAAMHSLDVAVRSAVRDGGRPPAVACAVAAALLLLALIAVVGLARGSAPRRRACRSQPGEPG